MMKKMKISTRLRVSFVIMGLFTVILGIVAIVGMKKSETFLNAFSQNAYVPNIAIKMCRIETNAAARTIREIIIETDRSKYSEYETKINNSIAQINENLAILRLNYAGDIALIERYEKTSLEWQEIGKNILELAKVDDSEAAYLMIINQCIPKLEELSALAAEIDLDITEFSQTSLDRTEKNSNIVLVVSCVLLSLAIIMGLTLSVIVIRSITRPLEEVENAALGMSEGKISTVIKYKSKDEIGKLADSLQNSMQTLAGYVADIDRAMGAMSQGNFDLHPDKPFIGDFVNIEKSITSFTNDISDTLRQINIASEQVASGSGQVAQASQELSQGATEQSTAIVELSSTIDDMTKQININAQNALQANLLSQQTSKEVEEGNAKMREMILAMQEITEKSNEINKIIKTIDDIAFQTNILALNAAVEAARAGSAGKGFAVVADEVRNLAGKSAEAAKNTTALIEGTVLAVQKGTQIADATAGALSSIVANSSKVSDMIIGISEASQQQSRGADQIAIGIEQIASVVQTNSATAEESAAASEELNSQALVLKTLTSHFNLRKD